MKSKKPWICFDESCKQLVKETRQSIQAEPGNKMRYDYQYERNGVANLFMFFEPLTGWRHVEVTERRTAIDYAHQNIEISRTVDKYLWFLEAHLQGK